jgi:hypothetical protein
MKQIPADFFEWHIFENPGPVTGSSVHPSMRMGPFAAEQECRTVRETLKAVPTFRDTTLEVRRAVRSREKRIKIRLGVHISPLARPDRAWDAHTVDISSRGARLANSGAWVKLGEFLDVRYGPREAIFRVVWIGPPSTPTEGKCRARMFKSRDQHLGSGSLCADRRRASHAGDCRRAQRSAPALPSTQAAVADARLFRQMRSGAHGGGRLL